MAYLSPQPQPPTSLGRYRVLSPRASIRVSPIQLGAMSIGTAWGHGMGEMDKASSFKLLDGYFNAGGNFIDTAGNYQDGTSEELIGEWMELRGTRDQIVIATKYSSPWKKHDDSILQKIHFTGNGTKLRTDYIDILYCHWYDWDTSVEELMNSLHNLVVAGRVLHLDSPAWVVSRAQQYAIDHGITPFCIYQGQWNLTKRSFERDIIPMARELGLALAPWDVLASGRFRTDAEDKVRQEYGEKGRISFTQDGKAERNEDERKMSAALETVAAEVGAKSIQAVAIAYHLQKQPYVFPIVGGRKVENLQKNIEALEITLSNEQIEFLENVLPFDVGFPNWLIGNDTKEHPIMAASAPLAIWPKAEPIKPSKQTLMS
ncbi:hypothetical protein PILCRDRAFT_97765 [Piloderma croceum F 1598]|uniref:NADP-dependent oxidoreductase domain-containing protein n=1 Tax=Piloderma croceum (strain F 1598) TaxID=765440 RepID=A0A0C3BUZ0_PILCF|nr:hypothetical protein PILCRDRAFT_97765 [Piloderma croceum F 1598]